MRTKVAEKRFRGGESAAAIARNWSVTGALDTFTIRLTRAPRKGDAMTNDALKGLLDSAYEGYLTTRGRELLTKRMDELRAASQPTQGGNNERSRG